MYGIIEQDEFEQSIENINRANSSRKTRIIFAVSASFFLAVGLALCIAGGISKRYDGLIGFSVLLGIGLGLIAFGGLISICACRIIRSQNLTQLREAVDYESGKYSRRTPISCHWRLWSSKIRIRGDDNHRIVIPYRVNAIQLIIITISL